MLFGTEVTEMHVKLECLSQAVQVPLTGTPRLKSLPCLSGALRTSAGLMTTSKPKDSEETAHFKDGIASENPCILA